MPEYVLIFDNRSKQPFNYIMKASLCAETWNTCLNNSFQRIGGFTPTTVDIQIRYCTN